MKSDFFVGNRFAAYLIVVALALAGAAPALAQPSDQASVAMDTTEWENLSIQLTLSLDSPLEQVRQEALQHINFFATHYGHEIDLNRAVPRLIRIYETDQQEGYRIMALAGLHAIGDRSAMRYLQETVRQEASPRVRQLTLAALADYAQKAQAL